MCVCVCGGECVCVCACACVNSRVNSRVCVNSRVLIRLRALICFCSFGGCVFVAGLFFAALVVVC